MIQGHFIHTQIYTSLTDAIAHWVAGTSFNHTPNGRAPFHSGYECAEEPLSRLPCPEFAA
jgi:hypothetical protein